MSADVYVRDGSHLSAPTVSRDRQEQKEGKMMLKPKVFATSNSAEAASQLCACCGHPHSTRDCHKFKKLDGAKKAEIVKEKQLCFKCLGGGHRVGECSFTVK